AISGCGGGGTAPSIFFKVRTTVTVNGLTNDDKNVNVGGFVPLLGIQLANACSQNPGGVNSFQATTDDQGFHTVSNAAIGPSCIWEFQRDISALCPVATINDQVTVTTPGETVPLPCGTAVNTSLANPSHIDPDNPPATFTITGQNMLTTYAMPKVDFYDQSETLHLEVSALSAAPDGTSLVVPAGQITFPGRFAAVVYVMDATGNWDSVGGADINVFVPLPPPPPRPTPCGGNGRPICEPVD
ncbi:MAG: hypothetical protein ACRD4I_02115, partial [Candidatus Angelobacter sp.]